MGNPKYNVTSGDILLNNVSISNLKVDERARAGLFLAYQYPSEVTGVTNSDFVRQAAVACGNNESVFKFAMSYEKACNDLKMKSEFSSRYLNEGFSGGEKKRNEILQMKMLKPKFAILDEIDSGLDVDALKLVGENVSGMINDKFGCLLITHYQRLLDYIQPHFVHIMINGQIVKTGGKELISKIDQDGYDWIKEELGIKDEVKKRDMLGLCGAHGK